MLALVAMTCALGCPGGCHVIDESCGIQGNSRAFVGVVDYSLQEP